MPSNGSNATPDPDRNLPHVKLLAAGIIRFNLLTARTRGGWDRLVTWLKDLGFTDVKKSELRTQWNTEKGRLTRQGKSMDREEVMRLCGDAKSLIGDDNTNGPNDKKTEVMDRLLHTSRDKNRLLHHALQPQHQAPRRRGHPLRPTHRQDPRWVG